MAFNADSYRVGIVAARFNADITEALVRESLRTCRAYRVKKSDITLWRVPGSVEIPVILQALAKTKNYDCLVALGAIIQGATPHFDYVAKLVAEGVLRVMLDFDIPIGFGILTLDTKNQAKTRLRIGSDAAAAALNGARLIKEIRQKP